LILPRESGRGIETLTVLTVGPTIFARDLFSGHLGPEKRGNGAGISVHTPEALKAEFPVQNSTPEGG
jgi:hypothetical protein